MNNPLLQILMESLGNALSYCDPFPGKRSSLEILINPQAGSIKNSSKLRAIIQELKQWQTGRTKPPGRELHLQIHLTETRSHAQQRALTRVESILEDQWSQEKILVLAGGDGFHKDICSALMRQNSEALKKMYLLRLPLGTGNDASDCSSLTEALDILSGPCRISLRPALSVKAKGLPVDYAFNIVSFGLDAYVSELTEKWKNRMKGDIYKIMVDLSVLFYDKKYPIKESSIKLISPQGEISYIRGKMLLTVIGGRGKSSYGGNKNILPDEHNVLLARNLPIWRRILLKGAFMKGHHIGLPQAEFYNANKMELNYPQDPLLAQLDGEVLALNGGNFPVIVEKIPRTLRVLQKEYKRENNPW